MRTRNWEKWVRCAGIRAVKTMAQAGVAAIGSAAVISQIDWKVVLSTMVVSGVLSMLTSVAGLPEEQEE